MTEQDIKLQLNKAQSLIKTDEAEASSVILELTNALGWEENQRNFFYNRFFDDPYWYD
ncbi:hypothetical protein [Veronia pacifica]|uniref:hypothetical protein n=1 Tax=Veronia pacifica TaxID=1080227 RepID=UPI00158699DA|nr:hypothetical protein [Veronia pacifica]